MQITGFPAGIFQTNCYIVADSQHHCVIIDPGQDAAGPVSEAITEHGWLPQAVLLTHGHLDHIWNAREVCEHYRIPAYIHPADRPMLTDPGSVLGSSLSAMVEGLSFIEPDEVIDFFDGDRVRFGELVFDIDHVPGHSEGSVSLRTTIEPDGADGAERTVVFGGDVLFQDGIGRTDLGGGDHATLLESIAKKFINLDDDSLVMPGHGPSTTIGRERRSNPFL